MVRSRVAAQLETWLQAAMLTGMREWQALVKGMRRYLEAVGSAFTLLWSNGQMDSQAFKLKR